jgi:NTP pyrophosphatase (non-canonical NTP hydrolase)
MTISEFQKIIEDIYFERDNKRGVDKTFTWFIEEVGELAKEIRRLHALSENETRQEPRSPARLKEEFADVFAWLTTLASLLGIDLEEAAQIYRQGCPKCHRIPCEC